MKLVIVSDTHGRHEELGILEGDVLIHCGDICSHYDVDESELVDQWFAKQRFSKILFVGGNHDQLLQQRADRGVPVFKHAEYLQDSVFTYQGVRFYGAAWVSDLPDFDDVALAMKWQQIPVDTDILITHIPPRNVFDSLRSGRHVGCPGLKKLIGEICPKIHCFGHVHHLRGHVKQNRTYFVNASVYSQEKLNRPIVINLNLN